MDIRALRRIPYIIWFVFYFLWELLIANLKVAMEVALDVAQRKPKIRPGVVAVQLEAETTTQITLLANLVSLTPGTLVLDVSSDRKVLFLHVMYLKDAELFPAFQDRFMRMFR